MTTEGKVSPLPWRVDPQHRADIQTVDGRELAMLWNEEAVGMTLIIRGVMAAKDDADGAANAAFIVRAVNAHDRLVAALEECAESLSFARGRLGMSGHGDRGKLADAPDDIGSDAALNNARAALAAAKEG